MSRVFVTQEPATYDRASRTFVPMFDVTRAVARFGRAILLAKPGNVFRDKVEETKRQIADKLADFSDDDYLLAAGDPVLIATAVLVAGRRTGGIVRLLKWDRHRAEYDVITVRP